MHIFSVRTPLAMPLLLAAALLSPDSLAFDDPILVDDCDDTGREVDEPSGKTHDPSNPCGSITIAGQTLVLPSCSTGYKWRKDTLYKSAPATGFFIPNWNNPSVIETYYIADPCPAPPTTLEELEAMAESGVNCKTPVLTDTATDYGPAIPERCKKKKAPVPQALTGETIEELYPNAPRMDSGGYWVLDLDAPIQTVSLPTVEMPIRARSLDHWPASASASTSLRGMELLAQALEHQPPLGSARIDAEVQYLFSIDGILDGSSSAEGQTLFSESELRSDPSILHAMNRIEIQGRVQADSSCDLLLSTQSFERQTRNPVQHQRRVVLSEGNLFEGSPQAERMHAYPNGSADRTGPINQIGFAQVFAEWLGNPLQLSMEQGLVYSAPTLAELDGQEVQVVSVSGSRVPGLGSVEYSVSTGSVPTLQRIETKDLLGRTVRTQDFANHEEVRSGLWRAMSLIARDYHAETGELELSTVVTLNDVQDVQDDIGFLAAPVAERWSIHY